MKMATINQRYSFGILYIVFAIGLSVGVLSACSSNKVAEANTKQSVAPEWTKRGNGAFQEAGKTVFYGVGMISGVSNKALAVSSVDDRARVAIGETIETYVGKRAKDFQGSSGNAKEDTSEQEITRAVMSNLAITLRGSIIVDRWTDPTDGVLYSLAKLDLNSVKSALPWLKGMSENEQTNSDKDFADLAAEEQKAKNKGQQGSTVNP
jgi:hypothetical protein